MRAFYATHKSIRVFVFGLPEGRPLGVYDLERKQWQMAGTLHGTLRDAKSAAEGHIAEVIGRKLPIVKWHLEFVLQCMITQPPGHPCSGENVDENASSGRQIWIERRDLPVRRCVLSQ
jgi:hypothetical protein